MQIQRGGRGVALPTLNIDHRKWWVGRRKPPLLYPREKQQPPNVQETEWASGSIWMIWPNFAPTGSEPWTFQPLVSRNTDYVVPVAEMFCATIRVLLTSTCCVKVLNEPECVWFSNELYTLPIQGDKHFQWVIFASASVVRLYNKVTTWY